MVSMIMSHFNKNWRTAKRCKKTSVKDFALSTKRDSKQTNIGLRKSIIGTDDKRGTVLVLDKRLIPKVLGRAHLDYEELFTDFCGCQNVINSRRYVSSETEDLAALTLALFLTKQFNYGLHVYDVLHQKLRNRRSLQWNLCLEILQI